MEPGDSPSRRSVEERKVRLKRYRQAREAGFTHVEALVFADALDIDVGKLRELVASGCPEELRAAILL